MARHYATIATSIWEDEDFRALSERAQRVYLMLLTQGDLNPVGVLPLTLRRWARYCPNSETDGISDALAELAEARFVVIDWDREELLVRTFVKADRGYTNPKRLSAIQGASKALRSPLLGGVLAVELEKLGISHEIEFPQVEDPSIGHRRGIDSPGSVVTLVSTNPHSTLHTPHPVRDADAPSDSDLDTPKAQELADPEPTRFDVERICQHLADRIEANGSNRPTITNRWKTEARLLIDRDGKSVDQIIKAIDWCQNDSFWKPNILSMPKLRAKYEQIRLHAQREQESAKPIVVMSRSRGWLD